MIYNEIKTNLFSVPRDYALAHCISADFALGAGIAKQFRSMGVRDRLIEHHKQYCWMNRGYVVVTFADEVCPYNVYNLVTKEKYWQKPTLNTVRQALFHAARVAYMNNNRKIAMPRIGCGLDRLNWTEVRELVKEAFSADDFEILVCYL